MNPVSIEHPPLLVTPEYEARGAELEHKIYRIISSIPSYQGIGRDDIYKLVFMERVHLAEGKFAYEGKERGYLVAKLSAYLLMLETLEEPLTPELVLRLHDANVTDLFTEDEPHGVPKGFRTFADGGEAFGLDPQGPFPTVSVQGVKELLSRWKTYSYPDPETGEPIYFLRQSMQSPPATIGREMEDGSFAFPSDPQIKLKPTRPQSCEASCRAVIALYETAAKITELDILKAVGRLCQDLDQLHLFVDGNIRTTGIDLLNRELLRNGLKPCALYDVNQIDCLHLQRTQETDPPSIVEIILEGQQWVDSLRASGETRRTPLQDASC